MNRTEKQQEVASIAESIGPTPNAFLVDFKGLDVARSTDLRAKLRANEGRLRIVKNRLAKRAFTDTSLGQLNEAFSGQTAIVYPTGDDVVAVAKTLRDFNAEHEIAEVKAGVIDGRVISVDEFKQLADLPSREQLIAKVLYMMQYPVTGLVTALSGVLRNFVLVLDAIRQQKDQ